MIEPYKSKSIIGCKKAMGQIKKVLKMIEDDKYCMDITQQIRAVEGLLSSLTSNVIESHLHTCAGEAFTSKDSTKKKTAIDELIKAFKAGKK